MAEREKHVQLSPRHDRARHHHIEAQQQQPACPPVLGGSAALGGTAARATAPRVGSTGRGRGKKRAKRSTFSSFPHPLSQQQLW